MNKNNFCIIMAGGIGSRFWPMSRTAHPKQFIDILGTGRTLIQQAFDRFNGTCPHDQIYIVTNEMYRELVKEQLPLINEEQIVCEPARRNTAPCIAYATYKIIAKNPNANIVVAPSDHIILKEADFCNIIQSALDCCTENDWLITLGITPSRPDTGYGYIQYTDCDNCNDSRTKKVKTFTEKPNIELAKSFISSGDFLWNSGIFIWSAKSILKAFENHLPDVFQIFNEGLGKYNTPDEAEFIKDTYTICKNISIDFGVLEKADNVYVYVSDFGWSDLGTWGSLYENSKLNANNNAVIGQNVLTYETKGSIINVPKNKLVVIQGLENYIVVESDGILLICQKDEEQQIRQFVNDVMLKKGDKYI
ncbi:MAG: mannose-1-phosphate guanylyltransferase [Bacteroidota bacterium]